MPNFRFAPLAAAALAITPVSARQATAANPIDVEKMNVCSREASQALGMTATVGSATMQVNGGNVIALFQAAVNGRMLRQGQESPDMCTAIAPLSKDGEALSANGLRSATGVPSSLGPDPQSPACRVLRATLSCYGQ